MEIKERLNEKSPLISVIVPVYNTVSYLDRCFESIRSQTFQNLEILVVDDGSTDGSSEKCDRWANEDPRVIVIHQKNAGISSARNAGLARVHGDYIGFVDSDDHIHPDMFLMLLKSINSAKADLSVCRYVITGSADTENRYRTTSHSEPTVSTGAEALRSLLVDPACPIFTSMWNKLYPRAFLPLLHHPDGHNYEDGEVVMEVLAHCRKVVILPDVLYYYDPNPYGITSTVTVKNELDHIRSCQITEAVTRKYHPDLCPEVRSRLLGIFLRRWFSLAENDDEDVRKVAERIRGSIRKHRHEINDNSFRCRFMYLLMVLVPRQAPALYRLSRRVFSKLKSWLKSCRSLVYSRILP